MHWDRCTPAALGLSGVGYHNVLLAFRVTIALYSLAVLLYIFSSGNGGKPFFFYTVWNFIALVVYFVVRSHGTGYCCKREKKKEKKDDMLRCQAVHGKICVCCRCG